MIMEPFAPLKCCELVKKSSNKFLGAPETE